MLSVAAHELRTPLAVLRLRLEMLREAIDGSGATAELLGSLVASERQVARLGQVIDHMAELGSVIARPPELELVDLELADLVRACGEKLALNVRCEVRADVPVFGRWDRGLLTRAFEHLLGRAARDPRCDAMLVEISCDDAGAAVALRAASGALSIDGADLEVQIARALVEAHGGSLRIRRDGVDLSLQSSVACHSKRNRRCGQTTA